MTGTHQRRHCPSAEQLTAFIEGTLAADQRRGVTDHLAGCPDCREVWYMGADEHVAAPGVPRSQRMLWYLVAAAVVLMATAALVWRTQGLWSSQAESEGLLAELVEVSEGYRFTEGRLSLPFAWAPPPATTRSGAPSPEPPLRVQGVAVRLRELVAGSTDPAALHAAGVALLSLGRPAEAVEALDSAALSENAPSAWRVDLAAALVELAGRSGSAAIAARAVDEAERAAILQPTDPATIFTRAVALELFGSAEAAIRAFEEYLVLDRDSAWAEEATQRLNALKGRIAEVRSSGAGPLFEEAEQALIGWATATRGQQATPPIVWSALRQRLETATNDRGINQLLEYVDQSRDWSSARRACLAGALSARHEWFRAHDSLRSPDALEAAQLASQRLRCAGVDPLEPESLVLISRYSIEGPVALTGAGALLERMRAARLDRAAGWLLMVMANDAGRRGDLVATRDYLEDGLRVCAAANDHGLCAMTHTMLSEYSWASGDLDGLWNHAREAVRLHAAVRPFRWRHSVPSAVAGNAELLRMDGVMFRFAVEQDRAVEGWSNPSGRILAAQRQADALLRLGQDRPALAYLAGMREQISGLSDPLRRRFLAEADYLEGRALLDVSTPQALERLDAAVAGFGSTGTQHKLAVLRLDRGRALSKVGRHQEALQDWMAGVEFLESQSAPVESNRLRVDRSWDLYAELIAAHSNAPMQALAIADRARQFADGSGHRPLDETILSQLGPDGAVLVFAAFQDRLVQWTLRRDSVQMRILTVSQTELERLVEGHNALLRTGTVPGTSPLSTMLVDTRVDAGIQQLRVVPDGPLHRLAFGTLRTSSGRLLVEAMSVQMSNSLPRFGASGSALRSSTRRILIAAGSAAAPHDGLSALPAVLREGTAVAATHATLGSRVTLLTDSEITVERLAREAEHADLLHLSGHAVTDELRPLQSRLVFGSHSLTSAGIASWSLPRRPTVVLAACDGARGILRRGSGPDSLVHAFVRAGASSVIAALWPVSDRDTSRFMVDLHERLLREAPAIALAHAQRAAATSDIPASTWAAFVAVDTGEHR